MLKEAGGIFSIPQCSGHEWVQAGAFFSANGCKHCLRNQYAVMKSQRGFSGMFELAVRLKRQAITVVLV
jgi:hypothetical protein